MPETSPIRKSNHHLSHYGIALLDSVLAPIFKSHPQVPVLSEVNLSPFSLQIDLAPLRPQLTEELVVDS